MQQPQPPSQPPPACREAAAAPAPAVATALAAATTTASASTSTEEDGGSLMAVVEGLAPPSLSGASPRNLSSVPGAESVAQAQQNKRGKTPTEAMSLQEQAILANIQVSGLVGWCAEHIGVHYSASHDG